MRILHLLQWKLLDIKANLHIIKQQGFDTIQISPIQGTKEDNLEFWILYQPTNFKIGNSQVGNESDLRDLCSSAKNIGISIIVDVVLRHTANVPNDCLQPNDNIDPELKVANFFKEKVNIKNYSNRWECINLCTELPMLNYNNKQLQNIYIKFLDSLKNCGVSGFRIDMAKHFAVPEEGSDFFSNVIDKYSDLIVYGEVIHTTTQILDLYSKYILVATDGHIQDRTRMITWVESHDDHLTFKHTQSTPDEDINKHYDFICSEYPNTLYYARPFSNAWKDCTVKTANLRHLNSSNF